MRFGENPTNRLGQSFYLSTVNSVLNLHTQLAVFPKCWHMLNCDVVNIFTNSQVPCHGFLSINDFIVSPEQNCKSILYLPVN